MDLKDILALLHPAIAVAFTFPLIGIVINRSWLTRQRRLQMINGEKIDTPRTEVTGILGLTIAPKIVSGGLT